MELILGLIALSSMIIAAPVVWWARKEFGKRAARIITARRDAERTSIDNYYKAREDQLNAKRRTRMIEAKNWEREFFELSGMPIPKMTALEKVLADAYSLKQAADITRVIASDGRVIKQYGRAEVLGYAKMIDLEKYPRPTNQERFWDEARKIWSHREVDSETGEPIS